MDTEMTLEEVLRLYRLDAITFDEMVAWMDELLGE